MTNFLLSVFKSYECLSSDEGAPWLSFFGISCHSSGICSLDKLVGSSDLFCHFSDSSPVALSELFDVVGGILDNNLSTKLFNLAFCFCLCKQQIKDFKSLYQIKPNSCLVAHFFPTSHPDESGKYVHDMFIVL